MNIVVALLCSLMIAVSGAMASNPGPTDLGVRTSFPFHRVGEELKYAMKWGPFEVGSGSLRILPIREVEGEPCFHLSLEVRTNGFADAIYKVRSRFDSYVSVTALRPVRYELNQREGKTRRSAWVTFDWETQTAHYQREGKDEREPVSIEPTTWDPLSVVYFFRQMLTPGEGVVRLPATDGKKFLLIDVEQQGMVKLEGAFGERTAMKVEPNTKEMRGVFQKSKDSNIIMWFSADAEKLPLRIQSKVIVGSFIAELESVRMVPAGELETQQ